MKSYLLISIVLFSPLYKLLERIEDRDFLLRNFKIAHFEIYYIFSIFIWVILSFYFHRRKQIGSQKCKANFLLDKTKKSFTLRLPVDGWSVQKSFASARCGFDNPDRYARMRIDFRSVPHPPTMYTHTHTHMNSHCRSTRPMLCNARAFNKGILSCRVARDLMCRAFACVRGLRDKNTHPHKRKKRIDGLVWLRCDRGYRWIFGVSFPHWKISCLYQIRIFN